MKSRAVWWGSALVCIGAAAFVVFGLRLDRAYTLSDARHAPTLTSTPVHHGIDTTTALAQTSLVTRGAGSLIMSVNCGVFGALPAFDGSETGWPGFPRGLAEERSVVGAIGEPPADGCTSSLDSAQVVRGPDNAPFTSAWGRLDQITVLDTRDDDSGWTLSGVVSEVVDADGHRWSGDYVGWIPYVTRDSARLPTGPNTYYDQIVTAGAAVLPGTGLRLGDGLGSGPANTLASAAAGSGLGEATIDGRLLLMLPVVDPVQPGYTAVVTLTLI